MWYGSLNIDGVQEAWCQGTKESVIFNMQHYMSMYTQEEDLPYINKRITLTIQKGKNHEE